MVNSKTGEVNNFFYSYNVGPAHLIAFSSEFYFYPEYGWAQIARQYHWLEEDLKEATKKENRAQRPWIIVMAHRPMYCSTEDHDDCTNKESVVGGIQVDKEKSLFNTSTSIVAFLRIPAKINLRLGILVLVHFFPSLYFLLDEKGHSNCTRLWTGRFVLEIRR